MPYVTTIERMAEARGKAEGKAEGRIESKIEMILLTLKARFGEVPPAVIKKIQTVQYDDLLNSYQLNAIVAQSLEDFVARLETSVE